MSLLLTEATFGPNGATGNVYWGTGETAAIGTWQIIGDGVPEPASTSLLGLGISALVASRWRQRRRA
jgi:hypothetical protein